MHKTIKKVSADIEDMKFNTAIASLMTLINEIYAVGHITKDALIDFIKLLCPFAPHICEEMYEELGGEDVLALSKWPEYDETKCVESTVEIAVQVNGKIRARINVAADISQADALSLAKAQDAVAKDIDGKTIIKELYVPKRLVNIVVK